jgi:hypothetical protein
MACSRVLLLITVATSLILVSVLYRVAETPFETAGHLILPPLARIHQAVVAAKHGILELARETHRQQQQQQHSVSTNSTNSTLGAQVQHQSWHWQGQQQEGKVLVTIMSQHWLTASLGEDWLEPQCNSSSPLQCRFVSVVNNSKLTKAEENELVASASAHLYHPCPGPRHPAAKASTPVVADSVESPANHPCMDNATVMQRASIDFSFRSCAQVGAQPVQGWPHGCSLTTLHLLPNRVGWLDPPQQLACQQGPQVALLTCIQQRQPCRWLLQPHTHVQLCTPLFVCFMCVEWQLLPLLPLL